MIVTQSTFAGRGLLRYSKGKQQEAAISKATMTEEAAETVQALLHELPLGGGKLASAAAFGVAGGAGAVYAIQHHGRVRVERAAQLKR